MTDDRPKHPSGQPLHRPKVGTRPIWRIPDRGPVVPRLQEPQPKDAIGFRYVAPARDEDNE